MAAAATDTQVLQSTEEQSTSLRELTPSTCGVGAWILRVVHPRVIDYLYQYQNQERKGRKMECILASKDSDCYCMGLIKHAGSGDTADKTFKAAAAKFKDNTIWRLTRITLAIDKPQYVSSPIKHVIDLSKTKVSPVLESSTFPKAPTPPDALATTLRISRGQKTDLLALAQSITNQRTVTAARGEKIIVDATVIDGSKLENGRLATITFPMFSHRPNQAMRTLTDCEVI